MTAVDALAAPEAPPRSQAMAVLELPEGSRLVHIGPHKTGTTALQAAFHLARDRVEEQGIHYASYGRQPVTAVLAGIGRGGARSAGRKPPNISHWRWLVACCSAASSSPTPNPMRSTVSSPISIQPGSMSW